VLIYLWVVSWTKSLEPQNLKAGVGQKSSDGEIVSGRVVKERKGRKGWESSGKKGEIQWGWGRKTPASAQGLRVNLGIAASVPCFPSCESGDLGVEPTRPSWVLASYVRMKDKKAGASYRLGVDPYFCIFA
jgi:hypothetical protein